MAEGAEAWSQQSCSCLVTERGLELVPWLLLAPEPTLVAGELEVPSVLGMLWKLLLSMCDGHGPGLAQFPSSCSPCCVQS